MTEPAPKPGQLWDGKKQVVINPETIPERLEIDLDMYSATFDKNGNFISASVPMYVERTHEKGKGGNTASYGRGRSAKPSKPTGATKKDKGASCFLLAMGLLMFAMILMVVWR